MATLTGRTLGKYQVGERLGQGGMAEVYKGYHQKLDRHVAIKVLHGYLAEGEGFLARFEREARAVAALRHSNIVQIHDFEVEDDLYYMVMEYVEGGTLKDRLADLADSGQHPPLEEIVSVIRQVAAALDYAHRQGIIHRDIKPTNVLLDRAGKAYLADFGIARIVSTTQFTATGALVGTPNYMSPEQCKGLDLTPASDIYSLGIILYELLTGQVPFDSDTPLAVLQKHINDPLPPPRALRADLPQPLEDVLAKALTKEPEARYQRAGELAAALEQAAEAAAAEAEPGAAEGAGEDLAAKPTVMMEGAEAPDEEAAPTVMMEETETAPEAGEAAAEEPEPSAPAAAVPEPAVEAAEGPQPVAPQEEQETPEKARRPLPLILALVAAVVVIALIALFASGNGGGAACASLEECQQLGEEAMGRGDSEAAAEFLRRAAEEAERLPPEEQPPYTHLWCELGQVSVDLGRQGEAISAFEHCLEWAGEDPGLQDMRAWAEENLGRLYGQ